MRVNAGAVAGSSLVVFEIFGPTFQGEGPSLGRRCAFVRLGGCNLHCRWCDSAYTWDWTGRNGISYDPGKELSKMTVDEVWANLATRGADMLVVSGGEPLLQQDRLSGLLVKARTAAWWVELETAGTIAPIPDLVRLVDRFNVSPKLENSANVLKQRYVPKVLDAFQATGKVAWKFVAMDENDLDEIAALVDRHRLAPVYVMPEGVTAEAVTHHAQAITEGVLGRGWNLTTRLHILLYGNRRGV
jgi:7-cyano-7-deazaguanosine (preQ0) biosynthesis protein QueE